MGTPRPLTDKHTETRIATWSEAQRRYLAKLVASLPEVGETAYHLGEREIVALRTAWQTREGWRVEAQYRRELAIEGLCEMRGPFLTAYGLAVRRFVMREDA